MVGLLVHDTRGPPQGLGLFGVASSTGRRACWGLATIVRMANLLAGLDELDEGFCDHSAVELLEVLQSAFVVSQNLRSVSDAQGDHFVGAVGGAVIAIRTKVCETVIRAWSINTAAANTARRSIQCTYMPC